MEAFEGIIYVHRSAPDTDTSSSDESLTLMGKPGFSSKNSLFDKNYTNSTIPPTKRQNELTSSIECRKKVKFSGIKDYKDYPDSDLSSKEVKESHSASRNLNSLSSPNVQLGMLTKKQKNQLKPKESLSRILSRYYMLNVSSNSDS